MKKVRFETPKKARNFKMNDSDCHSPRPFIERDLRTSPPELFFNYSRVLPYNSDPIQRFENSNSSPYPTVSRTPMTIFPQKETCWKPTNELDLSFLDASYHEPREPVFSRSVLKDTDENKVCMNLPISEEKRKPQVLSSIENKSNDPPNILIKDNGFFIKRNNLDKFHLNVNPIQSQLNRLSLGKENDPLARKADIMKGNCAAHENVVSLTQHLTDRPVISDECKCHHCVKVIQNLPNYQPPVMKERQDRCHQIKEGIGYKHCICSAPQSKVCPYCDHTPPPIQQNVCKTCNCHSAVLNSNPLNAVDQKALAIKKYEQLKHSKCMEVEKQTNVTKEKREPTVADLFKIIKLQNEQLQLLQEKVDKFISSSRQNSQPTITCSTEHVAVNSIENDQRKMSVGVMTSFEMIRTSTVINKEVVKQTNENQIQCNRSQISIKEVVSNPINLNVLEGIPVKNIAQDKVQNASNIETNGQQTENTCGEKTLNELSLYNVQVDNATTPLMSPEQTLYLDVRDYSDSETSSNDQSNVGWTYYNKVMTHVNGMLQDSEMPSSASAMYRNMRQQCVQMQIDKTNVSVTKRVKFGDDPLGLRQLHIYPAPSTDTSLKMNQLAAKYLKSMPQKVVQQPVAKPTAAPIDMSFATRNYMEKHRLLQGLPAPKLPQPGEIPRFLDITALKQQPKFL